MLFKVYELKLEGKKYFNVNTFPVNDKQKALITGFATAYNGLDINFKALRYFCNKNKIAYSERKSLM
ncbi:MAG: hypothetical protein JXA68_04220 [Ignavibacteriales bacterium]|nr:hypothetical protein [Ignavibacteriales bacterium]